MTKRKKRDSTEDGQKYYKTLEWIELRDKILKRDRYRCVNCGRGKGEKYKSGKEIVLHVHHIVPRELGGRDSEENLVTLCDLCHAKAHGFRQTWRRRKKR